MEPDDSAISVDSSPHRPRKWATFTALLIVGVTLALVAHEYMQSGQVVTTGASEWRHMTLSDGTAVHVDANSTIEIEYTSDARIVHLRRGGAVFDVAKNPKLPFIVKTSWGDAMAVGTKFGVAVDSGVTTTVSEGVVKVTSRGKSVMLKAGEELQVSGITLTSLHVTRVDAERKLLWAKGLLMLGGLTVAEGVEELNRRNRTQIIIDTPALGARVVEFASVDVDAPERYARMIASERGVTMTLDKKNGVIRLSE